MLNVIKYEDLRDIVLLGHSYGGMVATGVADRARDHIAQLVYIDAFVPRDSQSLFDSQRIRPASLCATPPRSGDGWRVPPMQTPPDTSPADVEWLAARRVQMPIKCFETRLKLQTANRHCRATISTPPASRPRTRLGNLPDVRRAKPAWHYQRNRRLYSPNVTAPDCC